MVYLKILSLLLGLYLAFQVSASEPINPDDIAEIIGKSNLPDPSAIYQKLLDRLAASETNQLGKTQDNWNSSNPKWNLIYNRVHEDLENDIVAMPADIQASERETVRDEELAITSQLKPSEIDTILSYYKTDEGKRYRSFIDKVDHITRSGLDSLKAHAPVPYAANKPTNDQMQQYLRMIHMSQIWRTTLSNLRLDKNSKNLDQNSNGLGDFIALIIVYKQKELESLDRDYSDDLSKFEAFIAIETEQHFIKAYVTNSIQFRNKANLFFDALKAAINTHEGDWQKYYKIKITQ